MQANTMAGNMQGVQLNYKAIITAVVALLGALYLLYSLGFGQSSGKQVFTQGDSSSWRSARLVDVPDTIKQKAKEIKVQERTLTFTSDDKVRAHCCTHVSDNKG